MKNVAASVRSRLLNLARETGRPFDELLIYFAMERFLYRLSLSPYRDRFILKGALLLTVWNLSPTRATRDIDLLGYVENDLENVQRMVRDVCSQEVDADGIEFDPASIRAERIIEHGTYEGVRLAFHGRLQTANIAMRLDIGFGDVVYPEPLYMSLPTMLDMPAPLLRGYTCESVIAEKFEAMVKLGEVNSRMKDFYDIWRLSRQFDFSAEILGDAIQRTFDHRKTVIPKDPIPLRESFGQRREKQEQWRAFIRRQRLGPAPDDFAVVITELRSFLDPIVTNLGTTEHLRMYWGAPGPWR